MTLLVSNKSITFVASRVITLEHNNEELRNTNGCYLVTQFSSNPTNRFILSELSFLAKVTKKIGTANPGTSEKRPGDGRPGQTKNGRGSSRPFDGWTQRGMIPRPSDYESAALTNWAMGPRTGRRTARFRGTKIRKQFRLRNRSGRRTGKKCDKMPEALFRKRKKRPPGLFVENKFVPLSRLSTN